MTPPDQPPAPDIARTIDALAATSPDEAARALRQLPKRQRAAVLAAIGERRRQEVMRLASHEDGTAGAIMTSRYAAVAETLTVGEALHQLAAASDAETIYLVFAVDAAHRLVGTADLRSLIAADRRAPVAGLLDRSPTSARVDDGDEEAARRLVEARALALPVLDGDGTLVGIITFDDAQRCLEAEAREDADRFSAIQSTPQESAYLDVSFAGEMRRRAPWILGLAVAGLMAGYIVHIYEDALDALVILALYMPMVADTGGNVGTQSASLVLRAIATGGVGLRDAGRVLWKETRVGLGLAAILFLFAVLKVWFISNGSDVPTALTLEGIGVAIGVAIAVTVVVSVLIGAMLPLIALVIRVDPAVFAGPALTTIVDVVGLFLYFQITTRMLGIALVE
ncbi:magnesium transporter [Acuticoccus sediminis]|uniref:magnesium transporter n=1 Tax=Acuticoccus sediminis TaxID=2184697 RepID=UPI001390EB28|nr:magnesium transporter [Acuticoccus sediminis]